jgi:hypothetical protein
MQGEEAIKMVRRIARVVKENARVAHFFSKDCTRVLAVFGGRRKARKWMTDAFRNAMMEMFPDCTVVTTCAERDPDARSGVFRPDDDPAVSAARLLADRHIISELLWHDEFQWLIDDEREEEFLQAFDQYKKTTFESYRIKMLSLVPNGDDKGPLDSQERSTT